jgi:serine/threonine protein phosphatase PrpC
MTDRSRDEYFGASVVGPYHRKTLQPNQDCWIGARGPFGTLIVASDGLGSRVSARHGARMACRAVLRAVRAWHRSRTTDLEDLLARIEPTWLELIAPEAARDCAATCLFGLVHSHGQAHLCAIGDGLVLHRNQGTVTWVVGPRTEGFGNETRALGDSAMWTTRTFPREEGDIIVLATDGVADDLLPDRINGFVDWLLDRFADLPPQQRWRALRNELKDWPTPHHADDKTLVALTQGQVAVSCR